MPTSSSRDASPTRDSIVLGAAVGVFGTSFGVLAVSTGLSVAQASAMSLLVFTGASQFAVVSILAAGGTIGYAVGSALLLAARNGAYGLALSHVLPRGRASRLVAAQLTIDESTAMATAQASPSHAARAFWVTGGAVFLFWNLGTVLGALAGTAVGDPATLGLDAAFPAGFVALLLPHLRRRRGRVTAGLAVVIALTLVPLTPPGTPILVSGLAVVPAVLFMRADRDGSAEEARR